jgi:hypothetical protein
MLGGALAVGVAQAPSLAALGVALAFAAVAILGAGLAHKRIRSDGALQIVSAALLGLLVVPVAQAGGGAGGAAAIALTAVFVSGALVVRVAFARARRRSREVMWYSVAAILVSLAAAGALVALGERRAGAAAAVGVLGAVAMLAGRPTPRELKALGLGLTLLVVVVGGVLTL